MQGMPPRTFLKMMTENKGGLTKEEMSAEMF